MIFKKAESKKKKKRNSADKRKIDIPAALHEYCNGNLL